MGILKVFVDVVYFAAALLMVATVLLQEGKGGGLSALGGTSAETAFGASNPLRRLTAVLAIVFFGLAVALNLMLTHSRLAPGEDASTVQTIPVEKPAPEEPEAEVEEEKAGEPIEEKAPGGPETGKAKEKPEATAVEAAPADADEPEPVPQPEPAEEGTETEKAPAPAVPPGDAQE